ncbi:hypothetical protein [Halocatena halophila]|uniref:hypothetical protein n=1 Tax=Halocatena halophila TaxID=2814576 RepID=UPI002ED21BB2
MQKDGNSLPYRVDRRKFLKSGIGVATATIAIPGLSRRGSAHFPNELAMDIRPGCERNRINSTARGVIPVAVYETEFTDDNGESVVFDPTDRAVRYRFGAKDAVEEGAGARPAHGGHSENEIDGLVLHFPTQETEFERGDTTATLLWERDETGNHGYSGNDSVTIVK